MFLPSHLIWKYPIALIVIKILESFLVSQLDYSAWLFQVF